MPGRLTNGPDDRLGAGHFAQRRGHGSDEWLQDPVRDLTSDRVLALGPLQDNLLCGSPTNQLIESGLERLDAAIGIIQAERRLGAPQKEIAVWSKHASQPGKDGPFRF